MSFVKALFRKQEEKSQVKTYQSIDDLPQWNWDKVNSTGNYAYLKVLKTYRKIDHEVTDELTLRWEKIYDEFIEEFGLSAQYLKYIESKKQIARLQIEFVKTGNRMLLNEIEIEEMDFKSDFPLVESIGFEKIVHSIEKRQSFPIDAKAITVYKYNDYLRTFKEEQNGK